MPPIEMDRFRLRAGQSGGPLASQKTPPRPRSGERFLKGPIPLDWLSAAACLPGKSLHVGIALWFMGGLHKSRVVPLSNMAGLRFGLDRNAKYRALEWLEQASLVSVERKLGRAPVVTILEAMDEAARAETLHDE
jgi:hypothetical protein